MATNLPSCFFIQFLEQLLKLLVKLHFVEICKVSEKPWLFNHKRADFWLPNFGFKRSLLSLLKVQSVITMKCPSAKLQVEVSHELYIMYQSIPGVTILPQSKFSKFGESRPPVQRFVKCSAPVSSTRAFLGPFIATDVSFFHHFQDLSHLIQFNLNFN